MKLFVYALHANTSLHKKFGTVLIILTCYLIYMWWNTFSLFIKYQNDLYKYLNDFGEFYTLIVDLGTPKPMFSMAT